jgi:hypothetical protein
MQSIMNYEASFIAGLVVGLVVFFLFVQMTKKKETYTITPFSGTAEQAKQSYTSQMGAIVQELKDNLIAARQQNQTVDQLVALSNTYNDQIAQLMKMYSEWTIRNVT